MHDCVLEHYAHTYYDLPNFIKIGRTVVKIWLKIKLDVYGRE